MTLAPALKLETTYQEGPPISLYFYPLCMDSIPWPYYQCKHIDGSAKIATTTKLKNFLFEDGHFGKGKILGDGKLFQNVNVNVDVQISLSLSLSLSLSFTTWYSIKINWAEVIGGQQINSSNWLPSIV